MKYVFLFVALMIVVLPITSSTADSKCVDKYLEQQMISNFVKTGDPALDLYKFAKDNNLDIKKAKKILSKNFGNPKVSKEEYFNSIAKTQNPDEDLRIFALANNLTNDEAKMILTQIFGAPKKPQY